MLACTAIGLNAQCCDPSQLVLAFCFVFGVFFLPWILFSALAKNLPVFRVPERVAEVPAFDLDLLLCHEVRIFWSLLALTVLVMLGRGEGHQPGWRRMGIVSLAFFYRTQVRSLPCLVTKSVALLNLVQIVRFVKVVHGFVRVIAWICQN